VFLFDILRGDRAGRSLIAFDCLATQKQVSPACWWTGHLLQPWGIWADKFIFWFNPNDLGNRLIGPLRRVQSV